MGAPTTRSKFDIWLKTLEVHSVRKCVSVIFAYRRVILLRSDIRLGRVIFGYAEFYGEYNITKATGFYITFAARQKHHYYTPKKENRENTSL